MRRASATAKAAAFAAGVLVPVLVLAASAAAQPAGPRPLPALTPAPADDLSRALDEGELSEAEYALERARSIFQPRRARRAFGDVARPGPRDATLLLRDLAVRLRELDGAEREAARAILARPDDGHVPIAGTGWQGSPAAPNSPACSVQPDVDVCVHWTEDETHGDAPPLGEEDDDDPFNGIPDWVDLMLGTLEHVWTKQVAELGYRPPRPDGGKGGSDQLDVYVSELGAKRIFGYCTSDDPGAQIFGVYAVWAYCVLDDDYAAAEFGTGETPEDFLRVTAAHEFHHAVQFAYDWLEDFWLMEGTAANIEETSYPDVDDNVTFLRGWSPLTKPHTPLDRGGFGDSEYGSWIFWRYLEEKVARGNHEILRQIWERADASELAAFDDQDSLTAGRKELAQRGRAFADTFVRFAVTNRRRGYADATKAGYPTPPLAARHRVGRRSGGTSWKARRIDHLATRFVAFVPGARVGKRSTLKVRVEQPPRRQGARVAIVVVRKDGTRTVRYPAPGEGGLVARRTGFGRGTVARVELVLANGSTRTRCWQGVGPPWYSCFGDPRDDRRLFRYRAKLVDRR